MGEEKKSEQKKSISVWVFIVLLIAAAIGGLLLGKLLFDKNDSKELKIEAKEGSKDKTKDEGKKENDEIKAEGKKENDEIKAEEIKETYLFDGENNNRHIAITINIINDNEMTISSGDGMAEIEGTKGIYYINDNVLTYTRIYYNYHVGGDKYWVPCITIDDQRDDVIDKIAEGTKCGGVSRIQKFTIDKVNNTLILNTKQNNDTDYAKYDDYASYDDIVLQLQ